MLNLQTLGEVASLLGTTEVELDRTLKHVDILSQKLTITDLDKPDKKSREVYNPLGQLRVLQRALHQTILLSRLDRSPHSFGGVRKQNQVRCARWHLGQKFVYTADIRRFYPSIHFSRVMRLFGELGCSTEVARALTRLTTTNYRLEQGFITSPILADRIFQQADKRIAGLCAKARLVYTRYVDDITISGPFNLKKSGIPSTITDILLGTGLPLHPDKNRHGSVTGRAVILGLRLNKGRPDISSAYHDETVRRLKDMAALGMDGEFTGPFFTQAELYGRMRYACWVNPNRRALLFPLWRAINWDQVHKAAISQGILIRECRYIVEASESPSSRTLS